MGNRSVNDGSKTFGTAKTRLNFANIVRKPFLQADQALCFAARSVRISIMFTKAERETKVKNRKGMEWI